MWAIYKGFLEAPISAKLGLLTIAAYLFVAVFAPFVAPYSETEILGGAYELWSEKFRLGTALLIGKAYVGDKLVTEANLKATVVDRAGA